MGIRLDNQQKTEITQIIQKNGAVLGYVFGSYARGTAGPLSDIDVAVAFPRDMSIDVQEGKVEDIREGLEKIFGRDKADVVNIPKTRNPLIRYIILLSDGELLFSTDEQLRIQLIDRARFDYEDTKPLRAIQREALHGLFT